MTIADGWGWMLFGIIVGLLLGEWLSYLGILERKVKVGVVLYHTGEKPDGTS